VRKCDKQAAQILAFGILAFILIMSILCYSSLPKFKVGNCLGSNDLEPWEHDDMIYKVLAVGKRHYHLTYGFKTFSLYKHIFTEGIFNNDPEGNGIISNESIDYIERRYKKVECP
jgi:hypothetical protein